MTLTKRFLSAVAGTSAHKDINQQVQSVISSHNGNAGGVNGLAHPPREESGLLSRIPMTALICSTEKDKFAGFQQRPESRPSRKVLK